MTLALSSAWRKFGPLGVVFFSSAVFGFGQSTPLTCTTFANPATIRAGGATERTADLVVTCTGGFPTSQGQTVLPVNWQLSFNRIVTSRPLSLAWSEALLLVDEPQPANQLACSTANGVCPIVSLGTPAKTHDGSSGHHNVYQSQYTNTVLAWSAIPFDPPGAGATRTFRFTNLRVAVPQGSGSVTVTVSASGQIPVTITNATRTVATFQTPVASTATGAESLGSRLSKFSINVAEQFGNVLKSKSAAGPILMPQSSPGASLNFETGFYNPELPTTVRGDLGRAGEPDSGTRVRVRINSVPGTATVTVPLNLSFGSGSARLVNVDESGIGDYVAATSGTLTNSQGLVIATYEIMQASSVANETLVVPFTLTYAASAPYLQTLSGDISLAPVHPSQIAEAGPIPRFNNPVAFTVTAPREPYTIVTTALLNGAVGSAYTQAVEVTGGLPPYTYLGTPLAVAPGLTFGTNGVVTGTPTTPGTYPLSVVVRDSTQATLTRQFSLTISAGSLLQPSLSKLDFSAILGGGRPPLQVFRVDSPQPAQPFVVLVDGGNANTPAPGWIQVTPTSGTTPGLITVAVNQTNLPEGSYSARIRVSIPDNPNLPPADVIVTLIVKPLAAKLESSVSRLNFIARAPAPGSRDRSVLLRNAGGGGAIPFAASILQRSSWITAVSPAAGAAGPLGTPVQIKIDSSGLAEGIYRDVVRFTSAINVVDVPVVLRVAPAGPLLGASPAGVKFSMREGARTLAVREVKVFNAEPTSTLAWTAQLIRGSEYFAISPATGTAALGTPGVVRIAVKPETVSLLAGTYYGLLRISAPTAAYSPRYVVAVLHVRPASQAPDLDFEAEGFVFTAFAGGQLTRRLLNVGAASQTPVSFQAAVSTLDGVNWLSVSPSSGSLSSTQNTAININVDPRLLAVGIYRGEVTLATTDASQTLPVTLIVTDAASEPSLKEASAKGTRAAACSANRMAVGTTGLTNNFAVPAGWPATLSVEVRDNCGAAVSNATVVARFSNGDPPMTLDPDEITGTFSGTWQPGTPLDQTNVTIHALNADFPEASATLVGSVRENKVPTLFRDGTIHNLDPKLGGLLAPGLVAQMYGTDLAAVTESTGSVPLSIDYKGTTVLVGPYEAPLYYVSPGQLVVQLPSELPPNRTYPILVSANGALTIPDQIDIVAVQPGVAAFFDGKIIAQHSNYVLVDSTNPAKRGEFLIMYLVGLGGTNQTVPSGQPSPGTLPLPVLLVPPTVTVDGAQAEVVFSGLTPFGVGLYQINFKVPDDARLNTPLEVLVKQGAYTANVTTLTVVP